MPSFNKKFENCPVRPAPQPIELSPKLPPAGQELVDSVNDALNETGTDSNSCLLDCDDGDPCTIDTCELTEDGEICVITPIPDCTGEPLGETI